MSETIGADLARRLYEEGVKHVFGVPGDYCLILFSQLEKSPIRVINSCDEHRAGFAADAYARLNGIGACLVTYCVGGWTLIHVVLDRSAALKRFTAKLGERVHARD